MRGVNGEQAVFGKQSANNQRVWRLGLVGTDEAVTLAIRDPLVDAPAAQVQLAASPDLADLLSDPELAHLVSFGLLDYLPMAMRVDAESVKPRGDGRSTMTRPYGTPGLLSAKPIPAARRCHPSSNASSRRFSGATFWPMASW